MQDKALGDYIIELERIGKTYPKEVEALRDVSVKVRQREALVVIGPSGAGKSTCQGLLHRLGHFHPGAHLPGEPVDGGNVFYLRSLDNGHRALPGRHPHLPSPRGEARSSVGRGTILNLTRRGSGLLRQRRATCPSSLDFAIGEVDSPFRCEAVLGWAVYRNGNVDISLLFQGVQVGLQFGGHHLQDVR